MSRRLTYCASGKLIGLSMVTPRVTARPARKGGRGRSLAHAVTRLFREGEATLGSLVGRRGPRAVLFHEPAAIRPMAARVKGVTVIPTETFVVERPSRAVVKRLRSDHGAEVVAEGSQGKVLFRVPGDSADRVLRAVEIARETFRRGAVEAAHPNFIRLVPKVRRSSTPAKTQWMSDFNGTSSATPHVAAAAALILSIAPKLTEEQVRGVITATAEKLAGQGGWTPKAGHGRLNCYAALRAARRL